MVIDLTGMEIANASLLDEGTAAAEAMAMLLAVSKGTKKNARTFFVDENTFPQTIDVLKVRALPVGINVVVGNVNDLDLESEEIFGILLQYPGADGKIKDVQPLITKAHEKDISVAMAADLLSLTLLTPPGEMGADVVIGTTQRFGIPMEGYTYFFTYEETMPHSKRQFWKMPCSLGADLSQGDDFCAFTLLFPLRRGFGVKTRSYITDLTLKKLPGAMRFKYEEFIKEGSLRVLDGTILDMMEVYDDLEQWIQENEYDVRTLGFDPYNAKEFVERWERENGPYGIEKVIQGAKTESVPLGELKILSNERMLIFDQALMQFAMGNAITLEDTNGNRKLMKRRQDEKIDNVAAMMDAYVAYKAHKEAFE